MQKEIKTQCWVEIKRWAPKSLSMNHYELAANTEIDEPDVWKEFLFEADVKDWLNDERSLLQGAELAKLTSDVANSRSVGQAQLMSAMQRVTETNNNNKPEGPTYIYCYIPLNEQQKHAPNVEILKEDIFRDKEKTIEKVADTDAEFFEAVPGN